MDMSLGVPGRCATANSQSTARVMDNQRQAERLILESQPPMVTPEVPKASEIPEVIKVIDLKELQKLVLVTPY